jgi:hypothetical protein
LRINCRQQLLSLLAELSRLPTWGAIEFQALIIALRLFLDNVLAAGGSSEGFLRFIILLQGGNLLLFFILGLTSLRKK